MCAVDVSAVPSGHGPIVGAPVWFVKQPFEPPQTTTEECQDQPPGRSFRSSWAAWAVGDQSCLSSALTKNSIR